MRRLYLRIYVAVLASLVAFALIAGTAWRLGAEAYGPRMGPTGTLAGELVAELLPQDLTDVRALHERLERWHARTRLDIGLYAADGTPIAYAGAPMPPPEPGDSGWVSPRGERPAFAARLPDGRTLVLRRPPHGGPSWRRGSWPGFFVTLAVIAIAVGVGAYPVVRRLTRRIERLQSSVEALGAGDFKTRVPVEGHDEVAALAASFNRSAERIEALVDAHKRLLAHASHELRSPLARIRMAAALLSKDASAELREELARDVAELDALIDEILLASRLDGAHGDALLHLAPVDLAALLAEECARAGASFETRASAAPHATMPLDERLVRRLVRNLLENAARHGTQPVQASLAREGDEAVITVRDHGRGVPPDERERIFEPFHRAAGASEAQGGVGLGLALVRRIARLHGGEVRCEPASPGSRFVVRLPFWPAANTGASHTDA